MAFGTERELRPGLLSESTNVQPHRQIGAFRETSSLLSHTSLEDRTGGSTWVSLQQRSLSGTGEFLGWKPQVALPEMIQHPTWTQHQPLPARSRWSVPKDQARTTEVPAFLRKIPLPTRDSHGKNSAKGKHMHFQAMASCFLSPWPRSATLHDTQMEGVHLGQKHLFYPVTFSKTQVYNHQKPAWKGSQGGHTLPCWNLDL
ncbi:uncharacterized protein LOC103671202 [Ursus maritimus]|uniref:Uncharacterized protein LOC103671202 n=1 Tax=Ursus maritimus TaxID=29073 RepID=A0A384CU60_URSMA|nr:uncharacterized protein LOC103671202 [Ursus maritimus]